MNGTFNPTMRTSAVREALKVFKQPDAVEAMTEYEQAQHAFNQNRERLKALRLARENEVIAKSKQADDLSIPSGPEG